MERIKQKQQSSIVLFSGGVDSTVLLYEAMTRGNVYAVSFAYGQRHKKELDYAAATAKRLGIEHQVCNLDFDWLRCGLLDTHRGPVNNPVVPNRNAIMINIAASVAIQNGIEIVYIGCNQNDWELFADCRPNFLRAMDEATSLNGVRLVAPFVGKTKSDIVELGNSYGVDWAQTWSCYLGEKEPCGDCLACKERKNAGV